jgi:hypothetical protein
VKLLGVRHDPFELEVPLQVVYDPLTSMHLSVGLQGSCILILDPNRFDLTVGGCQRLFS